MPHLEILPPPQRHLWDELSALRGKGCILYGGTSIALRLGHRQSIDFDFFVSDSLDTDAFLHDLPFMAGAQILRRSPDTLVCLLERDGGIVQISFFSVPKLPQIAPPAILDNGIALASLIDLAGTKAAVVQKRSEAKDYLDIDALIRLGGIPLPDALRAARHLYGQTFSPEITLKALCYYGDGNLARVPNDVRLRLKKAVAAVSLDELARIEDEGSKST